MNMKKTICSIVTAGMIAGCSTLGIKGKVDEHKLTDPEQANATYLAPVGQGKIVIQYDTDGDGIADVQHGYAIIGTQGPFLVMKYVGRWEDKNKDYMFSDDEFQPSQWYKQQQREKGV